MQYSLNALSYYSLCLHVHTQHFQPCMNNQTHTSKHTHTAQEAGATKKESKKAWEHICKCALDVLRDLHTRIDSGGISVRELHEVNSKKDQIHKLYSATVVDGKQRVDLPLANTMDTNMDQRFKEYQQFQKYQQRLSHILFFLKPESLPGNLL